MLAVHRMLRLGLLLSLFLSCFSLSALASVEVPSAAQAQQQLHDLRRQQQLLETQATELQEQLEALGTSPWIYQVLQQQRSALPRLQSLPDWSDAIAQLRLQEFSLNQQIRQARAANQDLSALLLEQHNLQEHRHLLVTLQQEQRELLSTARQLRDEIDERLFWVPSNPAMQLSWWLQLPSRLAQQTQNLEPYLKPPGPLQSNWAGFFGLLLPALMLFFSRAKLKDWMLRLQQPLLSPEQPEPPPSPWLTPQALAINLALLLPLPLVLLAATQLLQTTAGSFALAEGLTAVALSWLVVRLVHQLVKPQGLAELHFQWPAETLEALARFIRPLGWVLIPASFILALVQQPALLLPEDALGSLILVALGLFLSLLLARLLWQLPLLYQSPLLHGLVTLLVITLPLTLAVITSLGYYYTGLQLTSQLLASFYLLVAWVITEATLYRVIQQATARLAHQRELEEQVLLASTSEGHSGEEMTLDTKPLPQLEVDQVKQQALRLARFFLLMGFGGLFYWLWSDLLTAFGYLDTWVLWEYTSGESLLPISLGDLLAAGFILVFTLFLAANLPGLLEILVLSRLQLQQGSAYAITSLLNYAITASGFVILLATLGVSWDKLQWLVAALGVGLGFGLQEIFANFISGLILLFERPVRIGDVVTLGNLSGRVRQIRIRATIITDFDRKDIIVPNKSFITGQLINWSLTDTVTRVVVKIGVAYGSDLDKTRDILLEAAQTNTRVLPEPEPQVLFLEFGDSTLNHELRIHVKELSDRNPTIDEINRFVDRRFKEEGIEIAFRQLDIHLRNSEGVEKLVSSKGA